MKKERSRNWRAVPPFPERVTALRPRTTAMLGRMSGRMTFPPEKYTSLTVLLVNSCHWEVAKTLNISPRLIEFFAIVHGSWLVHGFTWAKDLELMTGKDNPTILRGMTELSGYNLVQKLPERRYAHGCPNPMTVWGVTDYGLEVMEYLRRVWEQMRRDLHDKRELPLKRILKQNR